MENNNTSNNNMNVEITESNFCEIVEQQIKEFFETLIVEIDEE